MGMPWQEFLVFYNKRENTNYPTVKDWLSTLYMQHSSNVHPVAKIIGVSDETMTLKLKKCGVFKLKKSVNYNRGPGKKELIYLAISDKTLSELTRQQIAERCGCALCTVGRWTTRYKRPYKKATNLGRYKNFTVIDYDAAVAKYNEIHNTEFKSEKELYEFFSPNIPIKDICAAFNLTKPTLYNRIDLHGVARSHTRGGSHHRVGLKTEAFLAIPESKMKTMSLGQIAYAINADYGYCSALIKKYKRTIYKRNYNAKSIVPKR